MAQPAGTQYIVFNPNIKVAQLGSVLPKMNTPLGGDWGAAWKKVAHTTEGCTISPTAGKDDIVSDTAGGSIGVVPSGDSEITIGFTPLTPDLDLFTWLANLEMKTDQAAVTNADPNLAFPAFKRFALTPEGKQFMFGVEGQFGEGSLNDTGGFVRAFGYKVEQTNDVSINMRKTTDDAVVRLEAEVRCLTTTVSAAQLTGTGISVTDDRFDMFIIPNV